MFEAFGTIAFVFVVAFVLSLLLGLMGFYDNPGQE